MLFTCCEVSACSEPLQVLHLFISMFLSLQDPTAYPYQFQDDPYLTPRTLPEFVCSFRSTLTKLALLFPAVIGHSVMIVLKISKGYYRLFETNPQFLIGIYIHHSLSPSFPLQKLYSLSIESGRSAAKYFIDNNPKFFAKDFAEPHIPVRHAAMKIPSQCTLVVKKKKKVFGHLVHL